MSSASRHTYHPLSHDNSEYSSHLILNYSSTSHPSFIQWHHKKSIVFPIKRLFQVPSFIQRLHTRLTPLLIHRSIQVQFDFWCQVCGQGASTTNTSLGTVIFACKHEVVFVCLSLYLMTSVWLGPEVTTAAQDIPREPRPEQFQLHLPPYESVM